MASQEARVFLVLETNSRRVVTKKVHVINEVDMHVTKPTQTRKWKRRARNQLSLDFDKPFDGDEAMIDIVAPYTLIGSIVKRKEVSKLSTKKRGKFTLLLEDELSNDMAETSD